MSKFKEKRARRGRCGLCVRKAKRLTHALSAGNPATGSLYIARVCSSCIDYLDRMPKSDELSALISQTLSQNASRTDSIVACYLPNQNPALCNLLSLEVDPIVARRVGRQDRAFFENNPTAGVRVREMVPGEFPPSGYIVVGPQTSTSLLGIVVTARKHWDGTIDERPAMPFAPAYFPSGPLYDRLKRLPQHERDRLMVSDRGLMCEVAATVWPALGLKEDLPERFQPPPERHHASPRAHVRRGHWRRTPSGKRIWISPAQIGSSKPRSFGPWSPGAVQCTACRHDPGNPGRRCSITRRYAGGGYWRKCAEFRPDSG